MTTPLPLTGTALEIARRLDAERWVPVRGYEGHYEVSDRGRVRSLDRIIVGPAHTRFARGRVLSSKLRNGYPSVQLNKLGRKTQYVHRLVATAFCERQEGQRVIRHLDGNPTNNVPSNLAWGTHTENNWDAVAHGMNRRANKTHCKHGHEFTPENTIVRTHKGRPNRHCRKCHYKWNLQGQARRRAAA